MSLREKQNNRKRVRPPVPLPKFEVEGAHMGVPFKGEYVVDGSIVILEKYQAYLVLPGEIEPRWSGFAVRGLADELYWYVMRAAERDAMNREFEIIRRIGRE